LCWPKAAGGFGVSLTPGFSRVIEAMAFGNRFNGFRSTSLKPLKRFSISPAIDTRLKPGVNEKNVIKRQVKQLNGLKRLNEFNGRERATAVLPI
jgi:hypothetical protein